ncbi:MAG: hypothetical protein ACPGVV_13320, partial [Croceimicrobium sp.]
MNIEVDITSAKKNIDDILSKRGLSRSSEGLKESGNLSTNLTETDINILNKVSKDLGDLEALSPNQILNLREKIDAYIGWDSGASKAGKGIAKKIRKEIDIVAKKQIPKLADLDSKFSPEVKLLKELRKDFYKPNGELKDSAMSKIANLTNKNNAQRLERLKKVLPEIDDRINAVKTVEAIARASDNKVGTYTRSILMGGGAVSMNPLMVAGGMAFSPRVVAGTLKNKALVKQFIKQKVGDISKKLLSGKNISSKDK